MHGFIGNISRWNKWHIHLSIQPFIYFWFGSLKAKWRLVGKAYSDGWWSSDTSLYDSLLQQSHLPCIRQSFSVLCFHEEPDGKLASSCNFISSHSIWFINLTNSLEKRACSSVPDQLPGTGPTLGTHHVFSQLRFLLSSRLYFVSEIKNSKWPSAE